MSAGITFTFSSIGSAKKACASRLRARIVSAGTPWPVMVKKPISVQVRSISRPVRSRSTGSPERALERSMTGIVAAIGSCVLSLSVGSMVVGAAVDHQRLAGDEGRVGPGEEGDGADDVGRRHVARQHAAPR